MKSMIDFLRKSSLFIISLSLLPGCDFGKKSDSTDKTVAAASENSTVLCKINGKSAITENEFVSNINQMLQANPYFKGASAETLPMAIKRKFFDELVKQELIIADATKNNLKADAEFQKAFADMQKLVERSLMVQFFEKKLYDGIDVSDDEISKNFEENKGRYIKAPGGVLVAGVRFEKDADATAFMAKVSGASSLADFETASKDVEGGSFKNFGRVGADSKGYQQESVPGAVKDAALSAPSLPSVEKVKNGKDIWVIHASDKRDAEYFDLAEIKPQISSMIKNNKFKQVLEEKLQSLRNDNTVDVNEDFFKEKNVDNGNEAAPQEQEDNAIPAMAA